jgi:hypothetical protein
MHDAAVFASDQAQVLGALGVLQVQGVFDVIDFSLGSGQAIGG